MALHPYLRQLLDKSAHLPAMHTVPVEKIRAGDVRRSRTGLPIPEVQAIDDFALPGPRGDLRVRLYRPPVPASAGPLPVTVFFHGSGFVICSIESHDEMCRHICRRTGSLIVSVDYALAPEQRFPAAPDDCLAAVRWVATHAPEWGGDPGRLAVAGDSAGGNLATVTALRIRDDGIGPNLRAQLLLYPVTNHYSARHTSYEERGKGFGLTREDMVWFWNQYVPDPALANNAYVSPLRAASLEGLPPAFIITAEYDLLRDEGEAYAARLCAAGVPTYHRRYADANHGFMFWIGLMDSATEAMGEACAWLKARLA